MGQAISAMLRPFVVIFILVSAGPVPAKATSSEPVVLFMGISGGGKTTTVNSLCETTRRTSSSMSSTTTVDEMNEIVHCGYMEVYDMVGLGDIPPGESIENAVFRGLEKTLSFIDGKNIGHIYFVTSTAYTKDHSRLVEQLEFIKGILNPMTKWTVVINCFNGLCPSDNKTKPLPEFLKVLTKMVPDFLEVRSPHVGPVDKALFPAPTTGYTTNFPPNWEELIASYDTDTLRNRTSVEAVANCKQHEDAYIAASKDIESYVCSIKACIATECPGLGNCPSSECSEPLCVAPDTCKRETVTTKKSWIHPNKRIVTTEMDSACLAAVTACNDARSAACLAHTETANKCNEKFSAECLKHQDSYQNCVSNRSDQCKEEEENRVKELTAVMEQHQPFVKDCQKVFTAHSPRE